MDPFGRIQEIKIDRPVTRIGIISDTHIPTRGRSLPRRLFTALAGAELILHAGDLVERSVLEALCTLAPVEAVAGNMDPPALQRELGRAKLIRAGTAVLGLVHGDGAGHSSTPQRALETFRLARPQAIVFGHSHRPYCECHEGILLFNPGSAVDPRWGRHPSCGLFYVETAGLRGEIIYL